MPFQDEIDKDNKRRSRDVYDYQQQFQQFRTRSRRFLIAAVWIGGIVFAVLICILLIYVYTSLGK